MRTLVLSGLFAGILAAQVARPVEEFKTTAGPLKITPIRHATLMMQADGQVVFVDPWSQANFESLPKADVILITDLHGDHMDPKAIATIRKESTKIFAPAAVQKTVTDAEVMNNGDNKSLGKWSFEAVPMYNLKRGPSEGKLYHEKGRGNGYIVTFGGLRVYIAGDTEGTPEMRALKNIDVAFVPMNLPYTMTAEEAADAVKAFKPKTVYPYHYRDTDIKAFERALADSGVEVRLRNWYY